MGSLRNNLPIAQDSKVVKHLGNLVRVSTVNNDTEIENIANSGTIRDFNSFGIVFGGSGTFTSGLTLTQMTADNSVDRQLFTENGLASGYLSWEYTRGVDGIQTSVSTVRANSSIGPSVSYTERKVFFIESDRAKSSGLADWNIFTAGEPVGAALGTTDTDTTPSGTWDERPHFNG